MFANIAGKLLSLLFPTSVICKSQKPLAEKLGKPRWSPKKSSPSTTSKLSKLLKNPLSLALFLKLLRFPKNQVYASGSSSKPSPLSAGMPLKQAVITVQRGDSIRFRKRGIVKRRIHKVPNAIRLTSLAHHRLTDVDNF